MVERNLGQTMIYWVGEVVDVNDIYQSGRAKVRVYGRHDDRTNIPDSALPWATVTQPVTSAAIGRVGATPVGLVVGSRVIGFWCDGNDLQFPMIIGTIGRAGDPIPGQIVNNGPAIDAARGGSTPPAGQGVDINGRAAGNQNRPDAGTAELSVRRDAGISVPAEAIKAGAIAGLPTVASYNKNSNMNVLDIVNAVDPVGALSSLPCLNNNLISISSILNFLGNTVQGVISGIVNTAVQAIKNAILKLAQKVGLFKIIGLLNGAVSKVQEVQKLMNTLNVKVCGVNLINQGIFDTANYAMASVIGGLNSAVGAITGGINNVVNLTTGAVTAAGSAISGATNSAINSLINSVPKLPAISVTTATSPRPVTSSITQTPPLGYIQQYYTVANDPYPGYIEWKDPTGSGATVYTTRNGEPNYVNAQEHTSFAAQDYFTSTIGNTLLSGQSLSFDTLSKAVSGSLNFTQAFGLSKVLGASAGGAQMAGVVAALIPTIVSGVRSVFQTNISQASYTSQSATRSMNNFMQAQGVLARQTSLMRAGLNRT